MTKPTNIIDRVKHVFEQVTFMDLSTFDDGDLEEDLGIDMDTDYPRIVSLLSREFGLDRDGEELLLEALTLKQVIGIIKEEIDLG